MGSNMILYNGKIHTIDKENKVADCVIIENGKFAYVGNDKEGLDRNLDLYEVVDLEGKTVLPGFIDAHLHMRFYADSYYGVNLAGLNSIEKYKEVLKDYLGKNPDSPFIRGSGWLEALIPLEGPSKKDLDEVSRDIPIVLTADSFHSIWVNSKALEMAGIDRDTPDIKNGIIQRDIAGEPSGTLREDCMNMVLDKLPDYTVKQYKKAFLHYGEYANKLGFVGALDACLYPKSNAVTAFKELAEEDRIPLYIRGTYTATPQNGLGQIDEFVQCRDHDRLGEKFSINTVKLFEDGVVEGKTAYLSEPYYSSGSKDNNYRSAPVWDPEELKNIIVKAMENHFQVHVHCIGDAAVKETLDAFEYAIKDLGMVNCRNVIAHIELIDSIDLERFKKLGIIALLNPYWAEVDDLYFSNFTILGEERTKRTWPIKSIIEKGIICGSGSDFPVTDTPNPFNGIEMGMTRTISKYYHPWASEYESGKYNFALGSEEEKASIDDMVKMFTYGAAYCAFMDTFTGSIEEGKNADFIIIDQDIYQIPPDEITNTKVLSTFLKGKRIV